MGLSLLEHFNIQTSNNFQQNITIHTQIHLKRETFCSAVLTLLSSFYVPRCPSPINSKHQYNVAILTHLKRQQHGRSKGGISHNVAQLTLKINRCAWLLRDQRGSSLQIFKVLCLCYDWRNVGM